ncbi:agmatinase [Artomyces pyxidatus]|uniref:Agmatinase n=1 Tax=Artomyces pyxidatus TaxID=48021 RepID=A0ACB8SJ30_9AGAM|nr:agmatinase [Artomyces pyxidatus]
MHSRLLTSLITALTLTRSSFGHDDHDADQIPLDYVRYPYQATYPGDNDVTANSIFSGITTFAKLPWVQCLTKEKSEAFDVAFIGAPFDTGTSYRPGARFGPAGIRAGSRRLTLYGGYNVPLEVNPFLSGLKIVDCGDIPVTPYDNKYAIQQIEDGHKELLHRTTFSPLGNDSATGAPLVPLSSDGKHHPRIITLGGDHTIVLPLLRSIHSAYGAISVIHFDSHLDTWKPSVFGGAPSAQAAINHGTYFYWASQEGLIKNGSSIASIDSLFCGSSFCRLSSGIGHGAIRTTLSGPADYTNDDESGFQRIEAREIDTIGTDGIIKKIRETVGEAPVYLSIDIDSIDPAFAPATGTPETGGWSTRELRTILRGLDGLHIVSADIVEVAPAYDTNAELTTMAAADVLYEVLSVMAKTPLGKVAN